MTIIYNIKYIFLSIINEATYYFSNDFDAVSTREKYLLLMTSKLKISKKTRRALRRQFIDNYHVSNREFLKNKYFYEEQFMLYILSLEKEELLQQVEGAKVMKK